MLAQEVSEVKDRSEKKYLLLKLETPVKTQENTIEYFLVSPRYTGNTIENIRGENVRWQYGSYQQTN